MSQIQKVLLGKGKIDFNWQLVQTFTHDRQNCWTHKERSFKTVSNAEYQYPKPVKYIDCVKEFRGDIFGCDTSIVAEV